METIVQAEEQGVPLVFLPEVEQSLDAALQVPSAASASGGLVVHGLPVLDRFAEPEVLAGGDLLLVCQDARQLPKSNSLEDFCGGLACKGALVRRETSRIEFRASMDTPWISSMRCDLTSSLPNSRC